MCSFPRSLIPMFKVQPKAGTEATFPIQGPATQEKKIFSFYVNCQSQVSNIYL